MVAFWFLVLASGDVLSCSCARATTERWESKQPYIFFARVTASRLTEEKIGENGVVVADFEVVEVIEGNPAELAQLKTTAHGYWGSCGIPFTAGDVFVIFTDSTGFVHQCNGTGHFHPVRDQTLQEQLRARKERKRP